MNWYLIDSDATDLQNSFGGNAITTLSVCYNASQYSLFNNASHSIYHNPNLLVAAYIYKTNIYLFFEGALQNSYQFVVEHLFSNFETIFKDRFSVQMKNDDPKWSNSGNTKLIARCHQHVRMFIRAIRRFPQILHTGCVDSGPIYKII